MSQSKTYKNDEAQYGADKAIDMDMDTESYAIKGNDTAKAWLKASLDAEYCIERVIQYSNRSYQYKNTYTCSHDGCTCEGTWCNWWTLSVYRQDGTVPGPDLPAGCKHGDIIKIQTTRTVDNVDVSELVIIPKLGELEYSSFDLSFF